MTSMPTLPPPSPLPLPLPLPLPPASTSPSSSSRHVPFGMSEALNQSIIETLTKSLNALHKHQRLGTSSSTPDLPNLEENDSVMESAPTAPASTKAKKKHKEDEDEGGEHHCRFQSLGCRHKPYKHAGVCLTKHQEICKYNPALAHLRGKRRSMGSIGNGHGITGVGPSQPSQPIPIGKSRTTSGSASELPSSSSSILSQSPSPSLSPASSFSPAGPSSFPRPQSVPNSMSITNGTSPRQHPLSHTIQPLSLSTSTSHTQLPFTAPVTPTSSIPSPLASPSSSTSSYQPVKRDSISATSSPLGSPRRVPYNRSARTSISGTSGTPSSRMPRSHSSLRFSTSGATSPVSQPRSIAALSSPRLASSQGPVAAHPALANLPSPNLHGHVAPSPFQFPSTTPPTSNGITRNRSSPSSVASLAASTAAAASAALAMQQQHALRQQEAAHSITTRTPSPVALPHIPHIVLPSQQVSSTNLSPIHHHLSRVNLNADNIYGEIANKTQTLNDMMASIIKDEHFVIPESLPISQPETVLGALNAESRYHQQQQQTTATTSHDYTIQPLSQPSSSHDYTVQPLSPNYMNPLTVTSEHSDNSDLSIHTSSNPRSPDTMITDSMSSLSDNISMSSNSFSQHSQSSSTTSIQSQDINIPSIESSCDFPIFPSYPTKDINDTFDSCHELTSSHDWNHTNMDYFLADQPNNSTWNTFQ